MLCPITHISQRLVTCTFTANNNGVGVGSAGTGVAPLTPDPTYIKENRNYITRFWSVGRVYDSSSANGFVLEFFYSVFSNDRWPLVCDIKYITIEELSKRYDTIDCSHSASSGSTKFTWVNNKTGFVAGNFYTIKIWG